MAKGDLEKADSLLRRAEAANPKYPVCTLAILPRVRRDLEKLAASRPAVSRPSSARTRTAPASRFAIRLTRLSIRSRPANNKRLAIRSPLPQQTSAD